MRHTTKAINCPTCGDRVQSVHTCRGPRRRPTADSPQLAEPPTRPDPAVLRAIYEQARAEARRAALVEQVEQPELEGLSTDE